MILVHILYYIVAVVLVMCFMICIANSVDKNSEWKHRQDNLTTGGIIFLMYLLWMLYRVDILVI